jgi:hypothetical protein
MALRESLSGLFSGPRGGERLYQEGHQQAPHESGEASGKCLPQKSSK